MNALATLATPMGALLSGIAATVVPLGTVFLAAGTLMAVSSLLVLGLPDQITLDEATLRA